MKKQIFIIAVFNFMVFTMVIGQKIQSSSFGKGVEFMALDSSMTLKMHFRMQNLFVGEYDVEGEEFATDFLVRRSRLKFKGYAFSPKLKYNAEIGLSNRDMSTSSEEGYGSGASRLILDAVLKYQFHKHWSFWVGQTKLPGNRERVVSSGNLQFVDRSNVNSKFNIDRDMGIQLHGKYTIGTSFIVQPTFALSQGEGRDITAGNKGGLCYTGRIDFLPLGEFEGKRQHNVLSDITRQSTPKLAIGFTGNLNQGAVRQQGQLGSFVYDSLGELAENDLMLLEADVLFKLKGFSLLSEFAVTGAGSKMDGTTKQYYTGTGFNVQAGYLLKNNVEFAGRFTKVMPDNEDYSGLTATDEYTLAVSRYVVGHSLKVQSDMAWIVQNGFQEELRIRAQIEMQF